MWYATFRAHTWHLRGMNVVCAIDHTPVTRCGGWSMESIGLDGGPEGVVPGGQRKHHPGYRLVLDVSVTPTM